MKTTPLLHLPASLITFQQFLFSSSAESHPLLSAVPHIASVSRPPAIYRKAHFFDWPVARELLCLFFSCSLNLSVLTSIKNSYPFTSFFNCARALSASGSSTTTSAQSTENVQVPRAALTQNFSISSLPLDPPANGFRRLNALFPSRPHCSGLPLNPGGVLIIQQPHTEQLHFLIDRPTSD